MFNKIKPYADAVYLITSAAGASAIALNLNINVLGYFLFLISSIIGFYLAYNSTASRSLLAVNAMFAMINVVGIVRYWQ